MSGEEFRQTTGGDQIQVGDVTHSQAVAVGRGATAIRADTLIYSAAAYPRPDYRSDAAKLVDYYTQTFVGREPEWLALAGFAGQAAPGYLLVEAFPGYGKSALMAHLVQRHASGGWDQPPAPDLLYFFIRQQGKRNTPVDFLQALNAQLLNLLDLPGGVPSDLSSLRAQFSQLWAPAVKAAGAVVSTFATPILGGIAGPITKFVLDN
jgi:hypothetical protein